MSDEQSKKREFRKYEDNRRLWDATDGKYATIADVVTAVVLGEDVSVTAIKGRGKKAEEGRDVTAKVLLDAFHHQQEENPTLDAAQLSRLLRGLNPYPWEG